MLPIQRSLRRMTPKILSQFPKTTSIPPTVTEELDEKSFIGNRKLRRGYAKFIKKNPQYADITG